MILKKCLKFNIQWCFRAVYSHPILFILGGLCYIQYRVSPSVFSSLISSSPVILCTTLLLGVLLSFGDTQSAESEEDEKISPKASSLTNGALRNDAHLKDNQNVAAQILLKRKEADKKEIDKSFVRVNRATRFASSPLLQKNSNKVEGDETKLVSSTSKGHAGEESAVDKTPTRRGSYGLGLDLKREVLGGTSASEVVRTPRSGVSVRRIRPAEAFKRDLEAEAFKKDLETKVEGDHQTETTSGWQQVDEQDGSSSSDSDQSESCSPDASVGNIMPILDETRPLLGSELSCPPVTNNDSDSPHISSEDSGDEQGTEKGEDGEVERMNNDVNDAAFLWTDDDRKNAMDLGYSELERNRRLESLMARRRSRKDIKFDLDKNLINLDAEDLAKNTDHLSHFHEEVAPISVSRKNPFDQLNELEELGIPGSAPSIMHLRKNPFDFYFDQSHGQNDNPQDTESPQQNASAPSRETFFRRYESFNLRGGEVKNDRRYTRFKPFFVPEGFHLEEEGSNSFHRSVSRLSAVFSTDSASSIADHELREELEERDKNIADELYPPNHDKELSEDESESSDGINSVNVEMDNSDIDDREISLDSYERTQDELLLSSNAPAHGEIVLGRAGQESDLEPADRLSQFQSVSGVQSTSDGTDYSKLVDNLIDVSDNKLPSNHFGVYQDQISTEAVPSWNMSTSSIIQGLYIDAQMSPRDLHPIPEETAEDLKPEEQHGGEAVTNFAGNMEGIRLFDQQNVSGVWSMSNNLLDSAQSGDSHQPSLINLKDSSNPFFQSNSEAGQNIDSSSASILQHGRRTTESLIDSDEEGERIYPEPYDSDAVDENILSELDAVGDFRSPEPTFDQGVADVLFPTDANAVVDSHVSAGTRPDNFSSQSLLQESTNPLKEVAPSTDTVQKPFRDVLEQTVYNPRRRILDSGSLEDVEMVKLHDGTTASTDSFHTAGVSHSNMEFVEAKSVADVYSAFKQAGAGLDGNSLWSRPTPLKVDSPIEFLEAKSLADIDLAFQQASRGSNKMVVPDGKSHAFGSLIGSGVAETPRKLHIVEARTIDELDDVLEKLLAGSADDLPKAKVAAEQNFLDLDGESNADPDGSTPRMLQVVEAKSLGDIAAAFSKLSAEQRDSQFSVGDAASAAEFQEVPQKLVVVKAQSLDDLDAAFKNLANGIASNTA